jgi:hypothetical protein
MGYRIVSETFEYSLGPLGPGAPAGTAPDRSIGVAS